MSETFEDLVKLAGDSNECTKNSLPLNFGGHILSENQGVTFFQINPDGHSNTKAVTFDQTVCANRVIFKVIKPLKELVISLASNFICSDCIFDHLIEKVKFIEKPGHNKVGLKILFKETEFKNAVGSLELGQKGVHSKIYFQNYGSSKIPYVFFYGFEFRNQDNSSLRSQEVLVETMPVIKSYFLVSSSLGSNGAFLEVSSLKIINVSEVWIRGQVNIKDDFYAQNIGKYFLLSGGAELYAGGKLHIAAPEAVVEFKRAKAEVSEFSLQGKNVIISSSKISAVSDKTSSIHFGKLEITMFELVTRNNKVHKDDSQAVLSTRGHLELNGKPGSVFSLAASLLYIGTESMPRDLICKGNFIVDVRSYTPENVAFDNGVVKSIVFDSQIFAKNIGGDCGLALRTLSPASFKNVAMISQGVAGGGSNSLLSQNLGEQNALTAFNNVGGIGLALIDASKIQRADSEQVVMLKPRLHFNSNYEQRDLSRLKVGGNGDFACQSLIYKIHPTGRYQGSCDILKAIGVKGNVIVSYDVDQEQVLMKEAVIKKTTRQYLFPNIENDIGEMAQLVTNAIYIKDKFGFTAGQNINEKDFDKLAQYSFIWPVLTKIQDKNGNPNAAYVPQLFIAKDLLNVQHSGAVAHIHSLTLNEQAVFCAGTINLSGISYIKAKDIMNVGLIASGNDITIEVNNFFLVSFVRTILALGNGHRSTTDVIANVGEIRSPRNVIIDAGEFVVSQGGFLNAQSIYIQSGKDIYMIPALTRQIINTWWDGGSARIEDVRHHVGEFIAKNSVYIYSEGNIKLQSPSFSATESARIIAQGQIAIDNALNSYSHNFHHDYGGFFSSKTESKQEFTQNPILAKLNFKGAELIMSSGDELTMLGVEIIARVALVESKTFGIQILSSSSVKYGQYTYTKSGLFANGMLFGDYERNAGAQAKMTIPSIIQIDEQFIGYSKGNWYQLSSVVNSKGNIELKISKDVILESAPHIGVSFASVSSQGIGFGLTANGNEFSVNLGVKFKEEVFYSEKIQQVSSGLFGKFTYIEAEKLRFISGKLISTEEIFIKASMIIFDYAHNQIKSNTEFSQFAAGVKLGITSTIGNVIDSVGHAARAADHLAKDANAYSIVNTASYSLVAMREFLDLVKDPKAIKAGAWFYCSSSNVETNSDVKIPEANEISAPKVTFAASDAIILKYVQMKAMNAYFAAQSLEITEGKGSSDSSQSSSGFDISIPIFGSIQGGAHIRDSAGNEFGRTNFNTQIHIDGNLKMEISGVANIHGASIYAKSLEASFGTLFLASVQDLIKHDGYNLGLSLGDPSKLQDMLRSISAGQHNRSGHIVKEITALVGQDQAHIIIANTLHLTGALIASAKRGDMGHSLDTGGLTMEVGELFIKHIYDYDNGETLGASIKFAQDNQAKMVESKAKHSYGIIFGAKGYESVVKATIGKGELKINKHNIDEVEILNRDAASIRSMLRSHNVPETNVAVSDLLGASHTLSEMSKFLENPNSQITSFVDNAAKSLQQDKQEFEAFFGDKKELTAEERAELDQLLLELEKEIELAKSKELGIETKQLQNEAEGKALKSTFKEEADFYLYSKMLDTVEGKDLPGAEFLKMLIGFDMHMVGVGVDELEKQHPLFAKFVDKIIELVNSPGKAVAESVGKGYKAAKYNLIELTRYRFGEDAASKLSDHIDQAESSVGLFLSKFSPTQKQEKALKLFEFTGISKSVFDIGKYGVKHSLKYAAETPLYIKFSGSNEILKFAPSGDIVKDAATLSKDLTVKLHLHEGGSHNGHAIERHIAKDENWLQNRAATDPNLVRKGSIASTFSDKASAERYIAETLKHNAKEVAEWMNNKNIKVGKTENFEHDFNKAVGFGVDKSGNKFELTKVRVVFKCTENGNFIITTYPLRK